MPLTLMSSEQQSELNNYKNYRTNSPLGSSHDRDGDNTKTCVLSRPIGDPARSGVLFYSLSLRGGPQADEAIC